MAGAYKAWIGHTLIGIGPGRASCGLFSGGVRSPLLCPNGMERVFDGFDVTDVMATCAASTDSCPLFVEAYGYDQVGVCVCVCMYVCVRGDAKAGYMPCDV